MAAAERADLAELWRAIGELPVQQREALVLREVSGLSYADLGTALAVSEPAVVSLLFRARRAVRLRLQPAYESLGSFAALVTIREALAQAIGGMPDPAATGALAKVATVPVLAKLTAGVAAIVAAGGTVAVVKEESAPRHPLPAGATAMTDRPEQRPEQQEVPPAPPPSSSPTRRARVAAIPRVATVPRVSAVPPATPRVRSTSPVFAPKQPVGRPAPTPSFPVRPRPRPSESESESADCSTSRSDAGAEPHVRVTGGGPAPERRGRRLGCSRGSRGRHSRIRPAVEAPARAASSRRARTRVARTKARARTTRPVRGCPGRPGARAASAAARRASREPRPRRRARQPRASSRPR